MNQAQGTATLYLLKNTKLSQSTFTQTFSDQTIVGAKLEITLPDGSVHKIDVMDILGIDWSEFIEGEEKATEK